MAASNVESRKQKSKLLVYGFIRSDKIRVIPYDIIDLFYKYYFESFEATFSNKFKADHLILSENDSKVTLPLDEDENDYWFSSEPGCCRGRDPINKGMIVEWFIKCYIRNGVFLGVVSSKCKEFNTTANRKLVDAFGIDDCQNRIYLGNNKRHVHIEDIAEQEDEEEDEEDEEEQDAQSSIKENSKLWHKPSIPHRNCSQTIRIICDWKTNEFATLTYYFDGKVCKPESQNYSIQLPLLNDNECWYLAVDFWYGMSWCQIYDKCPQ